MEHITKSELDYFGKDWTVSERVDHILETYCINLKSYFPFGTLKVSYETTRESLLKGLKGKELAEYLGYVGVPSNLFKNTLIKSLPKSAPKKQPAIKWINYLLKLFDILQDEDIKSKNIVNIEKYTLESIYRIALTKLDRSLVLNSGEAITADNLAYAISEAGSASKSHELLGISSHTSVTDYLSKGLPNTSYRERTKLTYRLLEIVGIKKCHECGNILPIENFKAKTTDTYYDVCRKCANAQASIRRAKIRNADYSKAFNCVEKINSMYHLAKDGEHVDHIVPLTHSLVCGLHVIDNLQIIPAHENQIKYNKFDPTTFRHSLPDGRDVYGN